MFNRNLTIDLVQDRNHTPMLEAFINSAENSPEWDVGPCELLYSKRLNE